MDFLETDNSSFVPEGHIANFPIGFYSLKTPSKSFSKQSFGIVADV